MASRLTKGRGTSDTGSLAACGEHVVGTGAEAESPRKKQLHYQAGANEVRARCAVRGVRSGQTPSILGGLEVGWKQREEQGYDLCFNLEPPGWLTEYQFSLGSNKHLL